MGGGTKTYENNYLCDKDSYLIIRNVRGLKTHFYSLEFESKRKKLYVTFNQLKRVLSDIDYKEITISSIVPYTNWTKFLELVITEKNTKDVFIRYMVHDFHCICPNYTLVPNEQFCEIKCLESKTSCSEKYKITNWRIEWNKFLYSVNEIRVFNRSSAEIIQRAFPNISKNKFLCVPHDMSYCSFKPIQINYSKKQRVAIVGACNTVAKGLNIVKDIVKEIESEEIILIGDIPIDNKRRNVITLGKYKHEDLPEILEKNNISTVIFPSVWPETFSYVISELILLNVKILCFDYGAQADKVKAYSLGKVCSNTEEIISNIRKINGD